MDRVIKFRGRRIDNGEWVFGDLITDIEGIPEAIATYDDQTIRIEVEIIPETVGQFTGLLDKNGDEIYEGDIIAGTSYLYGYELSNGKQFDYKGVVEWEDQCDVGLCWIVSNKKGAWHLQQTVHRNAIDYCTGEILGTIYDNPELLEQEEE